MDHTQRARLFGGSWVYAATNACDCRPMHWQEDLYMGRACLLTYILKRGVIYHITCDVYYRCSIIPSVWWFYSGSASATRPSFLVFQSNQGTAGCAVNTPSYYPTVGRRGAWTERSALTPTPGFLRVAPKSLLLLYWYTDTGTSTCVMYATLTADYHEYTSRAGRVLSHELVNETYSAEPGALQAERKTSLFVDRSHSAGTWSIPEQHRETER